MNNTKTMIKSLKKDFLKLSITKLVTIFTILIAFFSSLFASISSLIEKGYTEELRINNVTISLSSSSIFIYLFLPIVFTIITLVIIFTQKEDDITINFNTYIFKFLCFFQIAFFWLIIYFLYIITTDISSITLIPAAIMSFIYLVIFSTFYIKFKKNNFINFLNKWYGILLSISCLTGVFYYLLKITFGDKDLSTMLSGFAIVCAISSIIPIYILDDLKFFKSVKVRNKMRKIIHKSDSPAKCMKIFILISILLFLLNPYSFKNYGKNIIYSEAVYSTTKSSTYYSSQNNFDGYLVFKTNDNKYIAVEYKIAKKKSENEKRTYINILPGYRYININGIEILEQKFTVNKIQIRN